jgi:hypothetical protein
MSTSMTVPNLAAVRAALLSPDLHLCAGVGSSDVPGQGKACTIAEINLVLTGHLDDGPHPCMSEVVRRWVIGVQDAVPDGVRNGRAWREAAAGIAGSAASYEVETLRVQVLLGWMWDALGDDAVLVGVPSGVRPVWDRMLAERTRATAGTTAGAARAAARATAGTTAGAARAARAAAGAAARAAGAAAGAAEAIEATAGAAAWAAEAIGAAAVAAAWAADAAGAAAVDEFWARRDIPGTLTRLITTGNTP